MIKNFIFIVLYIVVAFAVWSYAASLLSAPNTVCVYIGISIFVAFVCVSIIFARYIKAEMLKWRKNKKNQAKDAE